MMNNFLKLFRNKNWRLIFLKNIFGYFEKADRHLGVISEHFQRKIIKNLSKIAKKTRKLF